MVQNRQETVLECIEPIFMELNIFPLDKINIIVLYALNYVFWYSVICFLLHKNKIVKLQTNIDIKVRLIRFSRNRTALNSLIFIILVIKRV